MEKLSDLNLYKLNMYIETWTTINNVDIPIYIDIADINEYEEYSLNNKVEIVIPDLDNPGIALNPCANPARMESEFLR